MKICTKCQIPQPLENFSNSKNKKDGKNCQCKLCYKQWCEDNKEIIALKKRQYREDNKRELLLKKKQYCEQNREVILLKKKQWYHNGKEEILCKRKQYRKTLSGRANKKNSDHKRRTSLRQGDVTTVQLKYLLESSTHCFYCNNPLILNETHIDHYVPLANGGLHTITNLRITCQTCNLQKGHKMPEEFLKIQNIKNGSTNLSNKSSDRPSL